MDKKSAILKKIRTLVEAGKQEYHAAAAIGITQKTLHSWSRADPRIAAYRVALRKRCRDKRTDMVEDAFFKMLIEGKGGAASYIFFLCNNRPTEWKNSYNFNHSGSVPGTTKVEIHPNKVLIFSDIDDSDSSTVSNTADIHAAQGPEGNRIEGEI